MLLVIDRTLWYRGHGSAESRLLRVTDGKMCCLGFCSLACGLARADIQGIGFPSTPKMSGEIRAKLSWLFDGDDSNVWLQYVIGRINDNQGITDDIREIKLTEIFAEHDVQVRFIN